MGVVLDNQDGSMYWDESGTYFPISVGETGDYEFSDAEGTVFSVDDSMVEDALGYGSGAEYSPDQIARIDALEQAMASPRPTSAEVEQEWEEADAQDREAELKDALVAEAKEWHLQAEDSMRFLDERLPEGRKLDPEDRQAILDDLAKTNSTDAVESYNEHRAKLSDDDSRQALLKSYAEEASEEPDEPEPDPVKGETPDATSDELMAQAFTEATDAAEVEEAA